MSELEKGKEVGWVPDSTKGLKKAAGGGGGTQTGLLWRASIARHGFHACFIDFLQCGNWEVEFRSCMLLLLFYKTIHHEA